jgi:hypothetical protein
LFERSLRGRHTKNDVPRRDNDQTVTNAYARGLPFFEGMVMSSGNIAPSSATVKAATPPCSGACKVRPPVYVNGLSTHQNTLSCRTPNSSNRLASSREHTWCSHGIIGLASHCAGSAHTHEALCSASSCHVPSCCANTRRTDVRHRPKCRAIAA